MSIALSQVTSSLCNNKFDELKQQSHIVSKNHLQKCGTVQHELTKQVFKTIFDIRPELQELYNLKMIKHLISGSYIFHRRYQRRSLKQYVMIPSIN